MRVSRITLFGLFVMAVPLAVGAEIKTATVERLLQREFVGSVLIQDERSQVYFERIGARGSSQAQFPYAYAPVFASALKKIYVAPMNGAAEARPLFEQDEAAGYYFASDDPWSPSRRYIAIYKLRGGNLQPGVYDFVRSEARFFDIQARYGARGSIVWVSDNELVLPDGGSNLTSVISSEVAIVNGARALAAARERGWRNGEVTADVVGAGRYAGPPVRGQDVRLVKINVRSGAVTQLEQAKFSETEFAKVFAPETASNQIAVSGKRFIKTEPSKKVEEQEILSIVDTSTGERKIVSPGSGDNIRLHSWSESGRYILAKRAARTSSDRKFVFSIVDTTNATIVEDLPDGAEDAVWIGDRLAYNTKGTQELLMNAGFDAAADHNDVMAFEIAGPLPLAASEADLFYLEDGDLWRVGRNGHRVNLTGKYPHSVVQYNRFEGFRFQLALTKSPSVNGLRLLDELIFSTAETETHEYIVFSADGNTLASIHPPDEDALLLAASAKGAVFLSNDYKKGSLLHYVKAGDSGEPQALYHFNKQLAGVTPSVGPIAVRHEGYDGQEVTGWLYLPPGASPDHPEPYPMVMIPYAGTVYSDEPEDPSDYVYVMSIWDLYMSANATVEVVAAQGYAVLLPSIPLGTRGEPGEPMTEMMPAILSSLDAAIATGFVDPDRLALSGHSYGGYTALSVAAQTDRFHAIVAAAPASNLISEFGQFAPYLKTNAGQSYTPGEPWTEWAESGQGRMGAPPWKDPDRYIRNSPLFHADRVETPLMLIHGDLDSAALAVNSEEMFTALRHAGKDVVFVRYVGEQHIIEQPQNQRDMWKRILDFLEENGVKPGPKTIH